VVCELCLVEEERADLDHLLLKHKHVVDGHFVDDLDAVLVEDSNLTVNQALAALLEDQAVFVRRDCP
jgi:hypothetical protein